MSAPVTLADDSADNDDACPALQDRAVRAYDAPECAYAREVTSEGDVFAGSPPEAAPTVCDTGDGDGLSCINNVTEVVEGFIEYGCAVPSGVEGLAGFLYPVHDYGVDFIGATNFYCSRIPASNDGCYVPVRDALEECTAPISAECFRQVPCPCVDELVLNFGDIQADDFREDFGPEQEITEAAKEARDNSYCQVPPSPAPTAPSGGNLCFISSATAAMALLAALAML